MTNGEARVLDIRTSLSDGIVLHRLLKCLKIPVTYLEERCSTGERVGENIWAAIKFIERSGNEKERGRAWKKC
jgi:hypothetical protein